MLSPLDRIRLSLQMSARWYGGRVSLLLLVLAANLLAVILFGGGLAMFIVSGLETVFVITSPEEATWFNAETRTALQGYGLIGILSSPLPMVATTLINRMHRVRCKACKR